MGRDVGHEKIRQLHEVLCDCLSSFEEKSECKVVDLEHHFVSTEISVVELIMLNDDSIDLGKNKNSIRKRWKI